MPKRHLADLFTQPLQDHELDAYQIGQFELRVECEDAIFLSAHDKFAFWKRSVAIHLASAMADTQVPQEYWHCKPTLEMQKAFNLPPQMQMKV